MDVRENPARAVFLVLAFCFVASLPVRAQVSVSPSSLTFSALPGGANPPAQNLMVSVAGGGSFPASWTAAVSTTSGGSWLSISPTSGTGSGTIAVSVNIGALAAGSYSGQVTVTVSGSAPTVVPVTLNVIALSVSPTALTFVGQRGGANPSVQNLQVTAAGGAAIAFTAMVSTATGGNWLSISPASGTTPATISASVNITGLAVGNYSGQVAVTVTGASPTVVPVTLKVITVSVSPATLTFSGPRGGPDPAAQNLQVAASDGSAITFAATVSTTTGGNWLFISPGSVTTPANISVSVNIGSLAVGTYTGQVTVTSGGVPIQVTVTLSVTESIPPQLVVGVDFLNFQAVQGSSTAVSQAITISNAGSGTLNWTAAASTSSGGNWLAVSTAQGTTPATLTISANPAGLQVGVYVGLVRITDTASNTPLAVVVVLTVNPTGGTILLSQSGFVFTTPANATAPLRQGLRVLNIGQGTLSWRLEAAVLSPTGGNWLSVDRTSGSSTTDPSTAAAAGVLVNPTGLPSGNYYGLLTASASGVTNSPQLATVNLRVVPATSEASASVIPSGFIFTAAERGPNPAPQTFTVTNVGGGTLSVRVSASTADGAAWLTASPTDAPAPATVTVQVNTSGLAAGVRRGTITLTLPGIATQDLTVLLLITAPAAASSFGGSGRLAAACTPSELLAVSTVLPNNFSAPVGWPLPIAVRVVDNCANAVGGGTVVANFSTGDTAVVLSSLRDGLYSGTWVPLATTRTRITIKALSPPLKDATVELTGQATPFAAGAPIIKQGGVVNGASFARRTPVAPGSIVSLFGLNLADNDTLASAPLPRSLAGLAVKIGSLDAPLFFAGQGQVNAQVPFELSTNTSASVVVTASGKVAPPEPLLLAAVQPGIFTFVQGGVTRGAVLDAQFRTVDAANAAAMGSVVQIFATGLGPTDPPVKTGDPGPSDPPARVTTPVQVTIGGASATVQFAGLAPGFTGLYQVNATVPTGLSAGDVPLVLTVSGVKSNEVMLAVR